MASAAMASAAALQAFVPSAGLGATSGQKCRSGVLPQSTFLGVKAKTSSVAVFGIRQSTSRVVCQAVKDRWASLATTVSDDQQDITRGKGMVDSLFQGAMGFGTQDAVMSSWDYISQGQRTYQWDNMKDGFYIAPAFMDKVVVHLAKNFMNLPSIKVPLILGVWGGKGQGKSFQAELIFAKLGINPIVMSAGELESGNAGEPANLIRQRYREAADIIKKGKMCCLFINDLDAGAGRMGGTTQYTVNNQLVNATLMNIADSPTNVQLPGIYNKEQIARVPIIVTGNDFSTLYAPLIRDGRMEKFYWAPTRDDRIGVCKGIFSTDGVSDEEVVTLVDTFPGQSIDFFGALRARVYDDAVRDWVAEVGVENIGKKLVNSRDGPPKFDKPAMTLQKLLGYGNMLVQEQDNVKRVQLADKYLDGAELGNANEDAIKQGLFEGKSAQQFPVPVKAGCSDPNAINFDPTARSDDGSCVYDFAEPINTPVTPIFSSAAQRVRGGLSARGRGARGRSVITRASASENGAYFASADSDAEGYYSDSFIKTAAPRTSTRGRGRAGRGRGTTRIRQPRPDGTFSSSGSDTESEGYFSDSVYSAPPPSTAEIVPIIAKSPPARGRGILGRKRGSSSRRTRPEGSAYSSGSGSDSEGYFSDSAYASSSEVAEIVPIVAKSPSAVRGRGRGRGRGGRRSGSGFSSGSGSDSEGYYSDSAYASASETSSEIVPIVAKSPPAVRGRGRGRSKRGPGRRSGSGSGFSSGSGSDSEGYFSDSVYSSSSETTEEITPIVPKSRPSVRGRGLRGRKRGGARSRGENGAYSSGSGSDSEGYYSDSVYASSTTEVTSEIVPIVPKSPPALRGRGRGRKRGAPRTSRNGAYSSGSGSESESEGYYSDSTYSTSAVGSSAAFESPAVITPIIPKAAPTRGRGLRGRKRGLGRSRSGSESGFSSGSESESEGYYSDSVYATATLAPPEPEPVVITPILPKSPAIRGGRGRGRGRR